MNINQYIQSLRAYPKQLSIQKELFYSAIMIALGLFMGYIAKMTDSVSLIGEIGTELGIWVFTAAIIAAYSRYPITAALNVLLYFLSMLFSYYVYGYTVLGFFPQIYFLGWLVIALASPIAGFCVWFSKAKGITGSIVTAFPGALLFAHGYPAYYTARFPLYLSLIMGTFLCAVLPKAKKYKIYAFLISIPIAFIIKKFYLFRFLP